MSVDGCVRTCRDRGGDAICQGTGVQSEPRVRMAPTSVGAGIRCATPAQERSARTDVRGHQRRRIATDVSQRGQWVTGFSGRRDVTANFVLHMQHEVATGWTEVRGYLGFGHVEPRVPTVKVLRSVFLIHCAPGEPPPPTVNLPTSQPWTSPHSAFCLLHSAFPSASLATRRGGTLGGSSRHSRCGTSSFVYRGGTPQVQRLPSAARATPKSGHRKSAANQGFRSLRRLKDICSRSV